MGHFHLRLGQVDGFIEHVDGFVQIPPGTETRYGCCQHHSFIAEMMKTTRHGAGPYLCTSIVPMVS